MNQDCPKIAILFGGCSNEYGISLKSAYAVISHLNREKYEPVLIGITQSGEWFRYYGAPENIRDDTWQTPEDCVRAIISPDLATHGLLEFAPDFPGGVRTTRLDAAMPVLHGKNGEDGTVQGLLELAGIPVVGCGALSSALCMDKDKAHKLVSLAGIRVPRAFVIARRGAQKAVDCHGAAHLAMTSDEFPQSLTYAKDVAEYMKQAGEIGYPLFVKPVSSGSSIGISKVRSENELPAAVSLAFCHADEVIVEEAIPGFEVGCAILGKDEPVLGEVDEIELADGFFDFEEKYTLNTSKIHVPARIPAKKAEEVKIIAKNIYRVLGCRGFARVDMFLTPSGEVVFNEVNTIPGFTAHSRFPNMLKAAGMTFEEIIDAAISQAVDA